MADNTVKITYPDGATLIAAASEVGDLVASALPKRTAAQQKKIDAASEALAAGDYEGANSALKVHKFSVNRYI